MSNSRNNLSLPTQEDFFENGLVPGSEDSPVPENYICSICTEDCLPGEDIVKIVICANCYFHKECLASWLTSTHSNRGTCPNDRTRLFTIASASNRATRLSPAVVRSNTEAFIAQWGSINLQARIQAQVNSAHETLDTFTTQQNAATTPTAIISAWHGADSSEQYPALTSTTTIHTTRYLLHLRSTQNPDHALRPALDALVGRLDTEYVHVRDRYAVTVRNLLQGELDALPARLESVRCNGGPDGSFILAAMERLFRFCTLLVTVLNLLNLLTDLFDPGSNDDPPHVFRKV
ncbi:hypothetical protein EJ02DRAFT_512536 [Clathrospora elynae]|uniref:RING-type domain-containing protein n=1 Tax=Clathrospora elynae TaxID=706981 RepID=A0A6A5SP28_9PLEO|nr:hypothetical protein EJ02DRAFT_512536 [Clathrospora elynae]